MSLTDEECSICFYKLKKNIAHTSCDHFFHKECIGQWIENKKYNNILCPICNQKFEIKNIYLGDDMLVNPILNEKEVVNENVNKNTKTQKSCSIL